MRISASDIEKSVRSRAETLTIEQLIARWYRAELLLEYARQDIDELEKRLKLDSSV